ncbi:MAG: ATP-binding protein [Thermotogae bacterium]|nr:ATP-binding protein [Thermotogota bacterium]
MEVIEELTRIQMDLVRWVPTDYVRDYMDEINWNLPLVGIVGARGVGKTVLVLQRVKLLGRSPDETLYVSADNPLVLRAGLYSIGSLFFRYGGKEIIIDEVHKYPNWATEVKALHDFNPDRKIVVLGSSRLAVLTQKGDLSRRMMIYEMAPLSFREYLNLRYSVQLRKFSISEILENHQKIADEILKVFPGVLKAFKEFLTFGNFPYFSVFKCKSEYMEILRSVLDKVFYEDIPSVKFMKPPTIASLKKLLAFVAGSPIPQISVASLTKDIGISRDTFYDVLDILEGSCVIRLVRKKERIKGGKIFLFTCDMYSAIAGERNVNVGTLREAFFVSQLYGKHIGVPEDEECDFVVDGIRYEIGGKSKRKGTTVILKDDIDIGFKNSIPLYLIGFVR